MDTIADDQTESLAQVGHAIYALLEQITRLKHNLLHASESLRKPLDLIVNEGDRFKIWSSSTGLLIPGHGSLDYRVREAEGLSKTFRAFLTDLRDNFREVVLLGLDDTSAVQTKDGAAQDDGGERDENAVVNDDDDNGDDGDILDVLLESIKEIVDRLFRLATKLRSPETRLRSSRARNFQVLDNGVDLFDCFGEFEYDFVSSLFRHYRRGPKMTRQTEHSLPPDGITKLQIDDKDSEYLIQRIAHANVARRRQFAYWKHHRLKLDTNTGAAIAARRVPEPTNVVGFVPTPVDIAPMNPTAAMTISTATQLLNPTQVFDDFASIASVSEYMQPSAEERGGLVEFPPPPHVATDWKFFECPYCFTTCAKKISRVKAWQAHVVHDLRPYICTYKDCKTADQLYDTKGDWIRHETTSHTSTWKCPVHQSEVFNNLVAFQLHAADGHVPITQSNEIFDELAMPLVMNKASRSCPVCTLSGLSAAQMNNHIATHLEEFAIFSLPRHAGMNDADEDGQGSYEANGNESSRSLDMESDLSFVSAIISTSEDDPQDDKHARRSLQEAEQKLLKELVGYEIAHGPDSQTTLATSCHLATLYVEQGEFDKAEQMYQRALAGHEKVSGPYHLSTLNVVRRLGALYLETGELDKAEQMCRRALAGYETALDLDHLDTLSAVDALGAIYQDQNKLDDAEQLYLRALAGFEKVLGPDSPVTLKAVGRLGALFHEKVCLVEAEQMYRRVIAGYERNAMPADQLSSEMIYSLGLLYQAKGMLDDAEQMYRATLAEYEKLRGPDSSLAIFMAHKLGIFYHGRGKLDDAKQLYERAGGYKTITQVMVGPSAAGVTESGYYDIALRDASASSDTEAVRRLLKIGAGINEDDGGAAIRAASLSGNEEMVSILLEAGVDANMHSDHPDSPLYIASRGGHEKIVRMLLDAGADANNRSRDAETPLNIASRGGHEKIVRMLLDAGADPNVRSVSYGNALQAAMAVGHHKIAQMLREAGAETSFVETGLD